MIVNREKLAEALSTTVKSITTWQNRGEDPLPMVSKAKRGGANEYDLAECVKWKIRQEVNKITVGEDGEYIDYEKERAALTKAQKEGQEIRNQIALGKVAPVEVLTFAVSKLASECAGIIDSLPLNIKRKHPELTAQQIESIKRNCVKAQNAMARGGEALEAAISDHIAGID